MQDATCISLHFNYRFLVPHSIDALLTLILYSSLYYGLQRLRKRRRRMHGKRRIGHTGSRIHPPALYCAVTTSDDAPSQAPRACDFSCFS